MESRLELQTLLEEILGSSNVYYQPPESVKMLYPAIIYSLKNMKNNFANNSVYTQYTDYEIIVIDKDPDSAIVSKISKLPMCMFDRTYVSDNLNHTVFTLSY